MSFADWLPSAAQMRALQREADRQARMAYDAYAASIDSPIRREAEAGNVIEGAARHVENATARLPIDGGNKSP